ncbi:uncharacterized protein [Lepeophtheirus salmonis]|uniref:uncharacterized protein isoform X2 n=1 Tax=Lepeophtheirus salmonis TaxID=72036 RepID=UPI001AEB408A|nr:uncharacterized protein LOC121126525 [Lepeophtheirus salmonis]
MDEQEYRLVLHLESSQYIYKEFSFPCLHFSLNSDRMKNFILFSLFTVLCIGQIRAAADESDVDDIKELERDPKSFYGFRRFPYQRRSLIPSRFYPNLFYSPVYIPRIGGLRRVYRSEPEDDIHEEPEKRSVQGKMALVPKWKADIIRNLFGKGNGLKPAATIAKSAAALQEELIELPFHGSDIFGAHHRSLEVDDDDVDVISKEAQDKISANIQDDDTVVVGAISAIEEEIAKEERRRRNSEEGEMEEEDQTELMDWPMKSRRRRRSADEAEQQEEMAAQPEKRSANPFLIAEDEEEVDAEVESVYMGDERMRRNIMEEEEVDAEVESVYMGDERMRRNIMEEEEVDAEVESVYMGDERMRRNIMEEEEVDAVVESVDMKDEHMNTLGHTLDEEDVDLMSMVEEVEENDDEDSTPQKRSTYFSGGARSLSGRAAPYRRRSASQPRKDVSSSLRSSLPRRSESPYSSSPRAIPTRPRKSGSYSSSSSDSLPSLSFNSDDRALPRDNFPSLSFNSDDRALPRDGYSGNVRSRRNVIMNEESEPSDEEIISMIDESEEEVDPFVRRYL